MKIAFDLDGVVRTSMLGELNLVHQLLQNKVPVNLERWAQVQQGQVWPQLNPMLLALPEDEIFVISASTLLKKDAIKRRWIKHFYGNRIKVILVRGPDAWGQYYVKAVARLKLKKMKLLQIDVYYDEDPEIVREMRRLVKRDALKIAIIHYGPWLEGLY